MQSIETNLERIANALEALVAAKEQPAPVAVEQVAAEAVEKAATKGRAKKADLKVVEPAPEPEAKAADPEPTAPAVAAPTVAEVQKRAAKLAAAHGKDAVFALINTAKGPEGKISAHTPDQLIELNELFNKLEAGTLEEGFE